MSPSNIPSGVPLHGSVTDPVGDAISDPAVGVSPDLSSATIDVTGGLLTATVSFAPGTLSHAATYWTMALDEKPPGPLGSVCSPLLNTN
jgi:hypothetical protein